MNEAGNERGNLDVVDTERYNELRKEHLEMSIELEKLRGEVERLSPYRDKWLDKVKTDLLAEYNLPEEQREYWKERITGDSEEGIKAAVEKLHRELRLDAKPKYVDPSVSNPRSYRPVARNGLYEIGQEAAQRVLGGEKPVQHVPERYGAGSIRSFVPAQKRKTPLRSERYKNNGSSKLYRFGQKLYDRIFNNGS